MAQHRRAMQRSAHAVQQPEVCWRCTLHRQAHRIDTPPDTSDEPPQMHTHGKNNTADATHVNICKGGAAKVRL